MSASGSLASQRDIQQLRQDFPALHQSIHGHPLVYLDNAATTQKPQSVLEGMNHYYTHDNANIHRGIHTLSERATKRFENVRVQVQQFLHAKYSHEIIFVRGATEGINLVATTFGRRFVRPGDEILVTTMEHHSNIVPWQMLCEQQNAVLKVVPINAQGELDGDTLDKLLAPPVRLLAITHVSNALGTINPVRDIIAHAHSRGIPVLVDGAQAVPHMSIDVQALDCDFYVFSAHKIYGPTGIGVLYGKSSWLEQMPPYQGGGDMIRSVSFAKTTYNSLPHKFEAGTPDIAGVVGLGIALDYLQRIGLDRVQNYEQELLNYGTQLLQDIPKLTLIGTAKDKASVLSFVIKDIHPHDIGTILDQQGIAIRAGHHCAQPLMEHFGIPGTARASIAFYNTREDLEQLARGLRQVAKIFSLVK